MSCSIYGRHEGHEITVTRFSDTSPNYYCNTCHEAFAPSLGIRPLAIPIVVMILAILGALLEWWRS